MVWESNDFWKLCIYCSNDCYWRLLLKKPRVLIFECHTFESYSIYSVINISQSLSTLLHYSYSWKLQWRCTSNLGNTELGISGDEHLALSKSFLLHRCLVVMVLEKDLGQEMVDFIMATFKFVDDSQIWSIFPVEKLLLVVYFLLTCLKLGDITPVGLQCESQEVRPTKMCCEFVSVSTCIVWNP